MRASALLLAIAEMILWLAGCRLHINTGLSGLSDVSFADEENCSVGEAELPETVEHIDIHWLVGNVTVKPHKPHTDSFSEESPAVLTNDMQMRCWLDGTPLHIQFCRSGKRRLDEMEKELTVLMPEKQSLTSLAVKRLPADVHLDTIQAETVDINTRFGDVDLADCALTDTV